MSIQESDKEAAAVAVAPRISLRDIEEQIIARYDFTGKDAATLTTPEHLSHSGKALDALSLLSVCLLVMKNGFTIVGKSAPASAENFDADFGRKLAYEDCIRQLWPLMGFNLRQRLSEESK